MCTRLHSLFFYRQYSDDSEVLVTLLQRQFAELHIFSLAGTWFLPLQVLTHFVLNVLVSPKVLSQTKVYSQMYAWITASISQVQLCFLHSWKKLAWHAAVEWSPKIFLIFLNMNDTLTVFYFYTKYSAWFSVTIHHVCLHSYVYKCWFIYICMFKLYTVLCTSIKKYGFCWNDY